MSLRHSSCFASLLISCCIASLLAIRIIICCYQRLWFNPSSHLPCLSASCCPAILDPRPPGPRTALTCRSPPTPIPKMSMHSPASTVQRRARARTISPPQRMQTKANRRTNRRCSSGLQPQHHRMTRLESRMHVVNPKYNHHQPPSTSNTHHHHHPPPPPTIITTTNQLW